MAKGVFKLQFTHIRLPAVFMTHVQKLDIMAWAVSSSMKNPARKYPEGINPILIDAVARLPSWTLNKVLTQNSLKDSNGDSFLGLNIKTVIPP